MKSKKVKRSSCLLSNSVLAANSKTLKWCSYPSLHCRQKSLLLSLILKLKVTSNSETNHKSTQSFRLSQSKTFTKSWRVSRISLQLFWNKLPSNLSRKVKKSFSNLTCLVVRLSSKYWKEISRLWNKDGIRTSPSIWKAPIKDKKLWYPNRRQKKW